MTSSLAELNWGALQLLGPITPTTDYQWDAMADGSTFGNPESQWEEIDSLLRDGQLMVRNGRKNRVVTIRLRLSVPRGIAGPSLAAGEAALMAQATMERPPALSWLSPSTDSVRAFYDVIAAEDPELDTSDGWDTELVMRDYLYWSVTLYCHPFVRPEETTVVAALAPSPAVPTTVDVDTCDSVTGWAYDPGQWFNMDGAAFVPLAASGGSVNASGTVKYFGASTGTPWYKVKRSGAIAMSTTPYLRVTATVTGGTSPTFACQGAGALIMTSASTVPGATDYYFEPTGSSVSSLTFQAFGTDGLPNGSAIALRVYHIARTDTLPGSGTTRQQSRVAEVAGSAPTQAAIRLYDATPAALGETLVYTGPNSVLPLRPWRVSSASVTADAARVSGGRNTLTSPMVFEFPASSLADGTYALMGMLSVAVAGDLTWSARTVNSSGATTLGSDVVVSGTTALDVTSGYEVLNLASLALPVVEVEGDQLIELTLTGTADMTVDEVWPFDLTNGVLTHANIPTAQWLEIRSPDLTNNGRPSIFAGTGAVGVGGVNVTNSEGVKSFNPHEFPPGLNQVFTVAAGSLVSQSELEFYARSHSHVASPAA